jgi:hypothetical protein
MLIIFISIIIISMSIIFIIIIILLVFQGGSRGKSAHLFSHLFSARLFGYLSRYLSSYLFGVRICFVGFFSYSFSYVSIDLFSARQPRQVGSYICIYKIYTYVYICIYI